MFFATRGKLQRLGQFTFATRGTIILNVLSLTHCPTFRVANYEMLSQQQIGIDMHD